ncbi:hypothetical protein HNY73_006765 [Argiope bruennichi]|uniref:Uncharacterized protein n=1 Tax=Argiope bruennichi TaxID=94029 RepID=A0A8T0FH09_ARGBR|nr:hypothetical protein HNY73_006765 [Argiope bruennichi]
MKSHLRAGTRSKADSHKLSDAQLLEKFGIKKCYVKLNRLQCDDYDLSHINSSLKKTDKTPTDENKHQMSESKHRESRKRKHFDSEIIKNDSQNLHNETLEKCSDLPEINEKTIDLTTTDKDRILPHSSHHLDSADYIFENQEDMNSAETYLAWKRSNESSSNLDYEISEAKLASLEEAGGIKLTEEERRKTNIIMNSSHSSRETLDSAHKCTEIILGDHKQEAKVSLKQTRKKDRTSTDSKRAMQDLGSECLDMAFSSPDQIEESNLLETDLSKNYRSKSSSNSNRETKNLDFEHSENIIVDHKQAVGAGQAYKQQEKQQRNISFFSSSREIKNLDIKCLETVLATQENRGERNRIQIRSRNTSRSFSNSSREMQNPNCKDSEMVLTSHELARESNFTEIDLSGKNIKSSTITSRGKQNLDFLCSKEIHVGPVETVNKTNSRKIGWMKSNRSFSISNRISQNLDSGSSETTPIGSEQMEECNLPETDLLRKNRTKSSFNSNNRTQNFNSECLKIARQEQEEPTVIDLSIKKRTRSSSACNYSNPFNSGCSETMLLGHENKEIDLSIKSRTRSSSTSDIRAQDFNSECSKKFLPRKAEENSLKEIDLSIKSRIRNSDSGTLLSGHERAVASNLKEIDLSKKNRARSSSNSCIETQNLEYLFSQEMLHKPSKGINQTAVTEKRDNSSSASTTINPSFNLESSETAQTSHEQTEKINQMQTRGRKSNRNPSDSSRETQNLDYKCYETVFINPEQELKSRLTEIGLTKNRDKTTVSWRNRPRSSSNSSEDTESLNSEFSDDLPIKSKQVESSSVKKIGLLGKKRYSDSNRETQNLDSEFSGEHSGHTKEISVILSDQFNLPTIKRTRYSSCSSNSLLETGSSQLEKKNEEHHVQIQKEEKECINSARYPNVEEENSILPTSRTTRNSSSFSRIRNFSSVLSEKRTAHMQTQSIDLMHKSILMPKKRSFLNSNNAMRVLHSEHGQKHFRLEQVQGNYLDCNLPAKKRARNSFSLGSTPQNSDSESSKKSNEHLQIQEFSFDSNLFSETEFKSSDVLNSEARNTDFSEKQKERVQTSESNQAEKDLCSNKNKTVSDSHCKTKKFTFKFSRQNPDDLKEQEVPEISTAPDSQQEAAENTIASDLPVSEKIKTHGSPSKNVNASHFENSYVKDCHVNNEIQTLSPACFNLNDKCEDSISENVEKIDSETEERDINCTDQQDVSLQQSISQTETSSCLNNKHNLSYSEILKTSGIEKNMKVPGGLLERQGKYPTENNVQETNNEGENAKSEFTERNNDEKNLEKQDEFVEVLENLMDCEKFLQNRACTSSNSRDLGSNGKHSKHDVDGEEENDDGIDWEEQGNDFEDAERSKEESLDAILKKEYGIRDCRVVLKRPKPFSVHYGVSFLKEIARKGYSSSVESNDIDFEMLYRRESFSQFSSLSQETFEHEVMKYIERFHLRDEFLRRRRELIEKNEAQLLAIKKSMKRKVYYDGSDFVLIKDERVQEVRNALRNKRYPLVLLEKNQQAEYLARKLVESKAMNVEQDASDDKTSENYRECDQYLEVDESEDESDQSDSEEANIFYDTSDDESSYSQKTQNSVSSFQLERSPNSLQVDEKLQDSNLDDKRGHIGKQPLICGSQHRFETMQKDNDDSSTSINSKPSENLHRLQNQSHLVLNPTLDLEQPSHLTLHSAKFKKAIADSHWPRVLLHPLGRTTEKECTKCLPTAVSERRCVPLQNTDDSERTDATSVLKKIEYDESPEYSSPSLGSETSLSTEHSDDDSENKSSVAANEEFFVIDEDDDDSDEDDDDSEGSSSYSDSSSESDPQQSGTESIDSHQNRDLVPCSESDPQQSGTDSQESHQNRDLVPCCESDRQQSGIESQASHQNRDLVPCSESDRQQSGTESLGSHQNRDLVPL